MTTQTIQTIQTYENTKRILEPLANSIAPREFLDGYKENLAELKRDIYDTLVQHKSLDKMIASLEKLYLTQKVEDDLLCALKYVNEYFAIQKEYNKDLTSVNKMLTKLTKEIKVARKARREAQMYVEINIERSIEQVEIEPTIKKLRALNSIKIIQEENAICSGY